MKLEGEKIRAFVEIVRASNDPVAVDDALVAIYDHHKSLIAYKALGRGIPVEDADAIALTTIWRCAQKFNAEVNDDFTRYLSRAIDNEFNLLQRGQKKLLQLDYAENIPDKDDPTLRIEKRDLLIHLYSLLTSRQKQVFILCTRVKPIEAAKHLGVTKQRVDLLLRAIRKKLISLKEK